MKTNAIYLFLVPAALAGALVLQVQGQGRAPLGWPSGDPRFGHLVKSSQIIGSRLENYQAQKLGVVNDLAVDLENGRIVEVIVAHGGFLGTRKTYQAVPPDNFAASFEEARVHGTIHLSMDRSKLNDSPRIDMSRWSEAMTEPQVEEVYQYYGDVPYFMVPEQMPKSPNAPKMRSLGEVRRATSLMGLYIINPQNETLGRVQDLVVDIEAGRVVEVIFASGPYIDRPNELSVVPPQALRLQPDRSQFVLDTTKDALRDAPRFQAHSWFPPDRSEVAAVYEAYHVVPYFMPIGLDTFTRNSGPGSAKAPASPPQLKDFTPVDMTVSAEIRKNIAADYDLSVEARQVKVVTVNGRVSLSGEVANEQEKRRVAEIAARTVSPGNIDNQLRIKLPITSSLN